MAQRVVLLLGVLALVSGLVYGLWPAEPRQSGPDEPDYRLSSEDCAFRIPDDISADCAILHTPSHKGSFALPVLVLRYEGKDRRPEPLLYLQGGPGASAGIGSANELWSWYHFREFAGLKRDLVLMDRRGTGASRPRYVCREYERRGRQMISQAITAEVENQAALEALEHCLQHELVGFDPALFGTVTSAQDVRALMALLQPDTHWHLLGVSYGSRLAMEVVRDTDHIASLILDSVYPPGLGGISHWPELLAESLAGFYQACLNDAACNGLWLRNKGEFTSIEQALAEALQRLKAEPLRFSLSDGQAPLEVVFTDTRLLSAVFSASYEQSQWYGALAAILAINHGDRAAVQALASSWLKRMFNPDLNTLAFLAVDCRDNSLGSEADYQAALAVAPWLAPHIGSLWETSICQRWPAAPLLLPDEPKVPVVLLAGTADPITPVSWAEWLHHSWPASELVIFPQVGHSVLWSESCALAQLEAYLTDPGSGWPDCR